MKAQTKYLIAENTERAEFRINQINDQFITKINAIASAIHAFGIPVTKPMVLNAIMNPDFIMDTYRHAQKVVEDERRKAMGDDQFNAMKSAMSDFAGEKERHDAKLMDNLCTACNAIKTPVYFDYRGMCMTDPAIMDWFDIDNDGHAFIPDSVKESIFDELRKFIRTSVGKELRDLQCDIAAKLEKMYHMMQTIDEARKTCLDFDAKGAMFHFPGALFEYKEENGFMRITPRALNFDPVDRDSVY